MRKKLPEETKQWLIEEEGYTSEEVERGFGVFSSDFMNGALHIEKYDMIEMYDGDGDAAEVAENEYGMKIINDLPWDDIPDYEFGYYLDEEDNVALIREHLKERYNIDWRADNV